VHDRRVESFERRGEGVGLFPLERCLFRPGQGRILHQPMKVTTVAGLGPDVVNEEMASRHDGVGPQGVAVETPLRACDTQKRFLGDVFDQFRLAGAARQRSSYRHRGGAETLLVAGHRSGVPLRAAV
jgi:hypothetical protein